MEELIRSRGDLRLKDLEQVIEESKDPSGRIQVDLLNDKLKKTFGSSSGGEYFMDRDIVHSRFVGIPALPKNAERLSTSKATIYSPKKGKNEVIVEAKHIAKNYKIPVAISVGGKVPVRIPLQRMYLEMASELHNRLLDEFGDRVRLTAVVGGALTRNISTVPIKVKASKDGALKPLIGTFPDLDFFAVIKGITEPEKQKIRKIAREIEQKVAKKYGFSENSYFIDVARDYGIVDEHELEGMAHSLHKLKPKIILHGKDFYEQIQANTEFKKYADEEMRRYAEKLGILSSAMYVRTIANVWRSIIREIEESKRLSTSANAQRRKELVAKQIIADELKKALQDVIEAYAPLGMNVKALVDELERSDMDRIVRESAPKIYDYSVFGGKRMYFARKLANNDKETARILQLIEAANNIAWNRALGRIKERNSMMVHDEDKISKLHAFRAAKEIQRKVLATAISDLIRAKIETGRSALKDGYKYLPEKIYFFDGNKRRKG